MADHAREMLTLAGHDLRALRGMDDSAVFADQIFGFHAQQAIEKTLKAWIASLGIEYPLVHNIARLLAILEENGCEVGAFWDLTEFTAYAVAFRYELEHSDDAPLDRIRTRDRVAELHEHVAGLLGI